MAQAGWYHGLINRPCCIIMQQGRFFIFTHYYRRTTAVEAVRVGLFTAGLTTSKELIIMPNSKKWRSVQLPEALLVLLIMLAIMGLGVIKFGLSPQTPLFSLSPSSFYGPEFAVPTGMTFTVASSMVLKLGLSQFLFFYSLGHSSAFGLQLALFLQ